MSSLLPETSPSTSPSGSAKVLMNWAETSGEDASKFAYPRTTEEVQALVVGARKVRVAGARHSCAPLIRSDELVISTEKLNNVLSIDPVTRVARFQAGVTCRQLATAASKVGAGVGTLGTIDWQTVVGAACTGTHGGSVHVPSMHSFMLSYTIVGADGKVETVTRKDNPELFSALAPSMGLMGVVTEAEMQLVPPEYVQASLTAIPIADAPRRFKQLSAENKYLRLVLYPTLDTATIWVANPITKDEFLTPREGVTRCDTYHNFRSPEEKAWLQRWLEVMETRDGEHDAKAAAEADHLLRKVLSSQLDRLKSYCGQYNHVLCLESNHGIPHADMELGFDFHKDSQAVLEAAVKHSKTTRYPYYNFEVRATKGDDAMLSCASGRDVMWIDFQAKAGVCVAYFNTLEALFNREGLAYRKHWAKGIDHSIAEAITTEFPRLPDFLAIRKARDPTDKFVNAHVALFLQAVDSTIRSRL